MRFKLPILVALISTALPAMAWNSLGHRAIAELVWRQMDLAERRAISDLLQQHPHYKELLIAEVPAAVDTNEWAFLTAAVWPDLVRPAPRGQPPKPPSITKYNVHPHAIGFPFMRPAETNHALIERFFIAKPDAEMVLSNCLGILKNAQASPHDRAVNLAWALHLFGDLHQPLHTASLVTEEKPNGDGLGGSYMVRGPDGKEISLHAYWDRLPGEDASYRAVAALADELAAARSLRPSALKEHRRNKTIHTWVLESHRVAVEFALAENRVTYVHSDALQSGKASPTAIPAMKPDYQREAGSLARRRLALAAFRLSDALRQVRAADLPQHKPVTGVGGR